jgi:hypothetical protein
MRSFDLYLFLTYQWFLFMFHFVLVKTNFASVQSNMIKIYRQLTYQLENVIYLF